MLADAETNDQSCKSAEPILYCPQSNEQERDLHLLSRRFRFVPLELLCLLTLGDFPIVPPHDMRPPYSITISRW